MIRVKLCGMMSGEDVALSARLGAHALGFVVEYPSPVPWNLSARQAAELVREVPPFVTACMVAGGAPAHILRLAETVRPDVVQLHGEETLAETAFLAGELRRMGIRAIKALPTGEDGALRFEMEDPAEAAKALEASGVQGILVDAFAPGRPGGSGRLASPAVFRAVASATRLPVILAGGLRAENIGQVIDPLHPPFAVDVLTGVESEPGRKDEERIKALLNAVSQL